MKILAYLALFISLPSWGADYWGDPPNSASSCQGWCTNIETSNTSRCGPATVSNGWCQQRQKLNGECDGAMQNIASCGSRERDCPAGTVFSELNGVCQENPDPPTCDGQVNPHTGDCEGTCPSGQYDTDGKSPGDAGYGACIPCKGHQMAIVDSVTMQGGGCYAPDEGCQDLTGKMSTSGGGDATFDYCQEMADECATRGGTYGAIGRGEDTHHLCMTNTGEPPPTCASGSMNWVENLDGSSAFACVPTEPPNDVCDGTKYDCDDDGKVDDQDKDGCVDNGLENDPNCPNKHEGSDTGEDPEGETKKEGEDPLDPAEKGAGKCDPTSQNYAECIGETEMEGETLETLEGIEDGIAELVDIFSQEGTGAGSSFEDQSVGDTMGGFSEAINDVPVIAAVNNLANAFAGSGTCPTPSFTIFGTSFSFDYHCTLYANVAGLLSAAMLVFWSLIGIREVMSA